MSATSFLPLWGQSTSETPEDCSSDRKDDLLWSDISRYALNTLTVPNDRAKAEMLFAIAYPDVLAGAGQFSKKINATENLELKKKRKKVSQKSTVVPKYGHISRHWH